MVGRKERQKKQEREIQDDKRRGRKNARKNDVREASGKRYFTQEMGHDGRTP